MAAVYKVPGPLLVYWGGATGAGTLLGQSKTGAAISVSDFWTPINIDATGQTNLDQIYTGRNVQVQFQALDFSAAGLTSMLSTLMSMPMYSGTSTVASCGKLLSSIGKLLTIVEIGATPANVTWTAPLAWPLFQGSVPMSSTQEVSIPITFLLVPSSGAHFSKVPLDVETV